MLNMIGPFFYEPLEVRRDWSTHTYLKDLCDTLDL